MGSDGYKYTAPVGSFPIGASPYGVMDMAGNVLEWCAYWYDVDYYNQTSQQSPKGPDSGIRRVLRGGSWLITSNGLRCANRASYLANGKWLLYGFRCSQDQ